MPTQTPLKRGRCPWCLSQAIYCDTLFFVFFYNYLFSNIIIIIKYLFIIRYSSLRKIKIISEMSYNYFELVILL